MIETGLTACHFGMRHFHVSRISIERFSFGDDAEMEIKGECVCHHGGDTIYEVYSVFSRRYWSHECIVKSTMNISQVLANTIVVLADIIWTLRSDFIIFLIQTEGS